jgi:protein AIR1/2
MEQECSTLWRLYDYHTDKERLIVLRRRQDKGHLGLGNGGEGYIADDEWCYNCGNCGHWGDVSMSSNSYLNSVVTMMA